MAAGDGLISMTPTSIAHAGTSASINADGGVDFSAVTSLSLNGVFTGSYDNYLIWLGSVPSGTDVGYKLRLRASGTDNSTANSYTQERLFADNATVNGSRTTSNEVLNALYGSSTSRNVGVLHIYGPYLAQPTAGRSVGGYGYSSAYLEDTAWTHNQSTVYDGFTLYLATQNFTGTVHVFGYEE